MAARFERSGELLFYHSIPVVPEQAKHDSRRRRLGVWLAVAAVVVGLLFLAPHVLAAGHAQSFLGGGLVR